MEIYTEATSAATQDALKRLGDELSPHDHQTPADPLPEVGEHLDDDPLA